MSSEVYIAGVGMTSFGKHLDTSVKQLTRAAVEDALADAGCDSRQLQGAFFGNSTQGHMEGQHMIRGQLALRAMGIDRIPVINVENACASASTAFHLAVNYVKAGAANIVLAGRRCSRRTRRARSARSTVHGTCTTRRTASAGCWKWATASSRPREAYRRSPTASSWTSTRRWAACTCASSAPHNGSSPPCQPRTTGIRSTISSRSISRPTRSRRSSARRRLPIRSRCRCAPLSATGRQRRSYVARPGSNCSRDGARGPFACSHRCCRRAPSDRPLRSTSIWSG